MPCPTRLSGFAKILAGAVLVLGLSLSPTGESRAQDSSDGGEFRWELLPEEALDKGFYQSYLYGVPERPSDAWTLAYGGRLYDIWWVVLLTDPPSGRHPSYPSKGTASDLETWRCVTCHGWDYRGRNGNFGKGPHYTGIKGIDAMAGADPGSIMAALRAPVHGYTEAMIPNRALAALARFVSEGQGQPTANIDDATRKVRGNPEEGRTLFQTICAICHDFDGRAWITGEDDGLSNLGAIASADPWRALHKMANGQTYADMPALRGLGEDALYNLLAYLQTLPSESIEQ